MLKSRYIYVSFRTQTSNTHVSGYITTSALVLDLRASCPRRLEFLISWEYTTGACLENSFRLTLF